MCTPKRKPGVKGDKERGHTSAGSMALRSEECPLLTLKHNGHTERAEVRYQKSDTRSQIPEVRYQKSDTRSQKSDTRYQIPDTRYQIPEIKSGIKNQESGIKKSDTNAQGCLKHKILI
jgi:hypothetical protein